MAHSYVCHEWACFVCCQEEAAWLLLAALRCCAKRASRSVLQCVAVCCSVLQCVAVCCIEENTYVHESLHIYVWREHIYGCGHIHGCGGRDREGKTAGSDDSRECHSTDSIACAVCCSVLQCVAVCCSVLQCVAVCCSVLQCVAVCCSVLQRVVCGM